MSCRCAIRFRNCYFHPGDHVGSKTTFFYKTLNPRFYAVAKSSLGRLLVSFRCAISRWNFLIRKWEFCAEFDWLNDWLITILRHFRNIATILLRTEFDHVYSSKLWNDSCDFYTNTKKSIIKYKHLCPGITVLRQHLVVNNLNYLRRKKLRGCCCCCCYGCWSSQNYIIILWKKYPKRINNTLFQ